MAPTPSTQSGTNAVCHHAQRYDRYQQVLALRAQRLTTKEIARRLGMKDRTVRSWLQQGMPAEAKRRGKRSSTFDAYATYVLKRWQEGQRNGLRIFQELQVQGYQGSSRTVYRFLAARKREETRSRWRSRMALTGFYCARGRLVICA